MLFIQVHGKGGFAVLLYKNRYIVPSIRLQRWDYRSPGWYFITICTQERRTKPFGFIRNGYMCLSDIGTIVARAWLQTTIIRPYIDLDAWVVMPDHVHGIIRIMGYRFENNIPSVYDIRSVETHGHASLQITDGIQQIIDGIQTNHTSRRQYNRFGPQSNNLAAIIRGFKGTTTKQIHMIGHNYFQWQPRYYEKIIRSERELFHIRRYILNNPKKWYNRVE